MRLTAARATRTEGPRQMPSPERPRPRRSPVEALRALQRSHGNRFVAGVVGRAELAGGGRPLSDPDRTYYEARLGADFGRVRVHTGGRAEELTEALHARAFTVGRDIVFGRGEYAPWSTRGRRLLAHELAHVVQAAGGTPNGSSGVAERSSLPSPLAVSRPSDVAERQAERVANRLVTGDADVPTLSAASPAVIHRAEPETDAGPDRGPVDLPPLEDLPEATVELAQRTAEEINDTVARGWDEASGRKKLGALLLALEVEDILRTTFEQGHGAAPQLRESDAPVLQYFVARHPGLRERLMLLRFRAGENNSERIGKYLGIQVATGRFFTYQIQMYGSSGDIGVGIEQNTVRIRYLEDGRQRWEAEYKFVGTGTGVGLPAGISTDLGWNDFATPQYWAPEDFVGQMDIIGGALAPGSIGYEIEAAIFTGNGEHIPVEADVGGWIFGLDVGVGAVTGRLTLTQQGPTPPPTRTPAPPPRFVERIPVHDQLVIEFATNRSTVDNRGLRMLADFVARNRELFAGGDYELQLIGNASRAGAADENLELSERRRQTVRAEIEALLKFRELPPLGERVTGVALGEQQAVADGKPPTDDSAEYRTVEIALNGTYVREPVLTP